MTPEERLFGVMAIAEENTKAAKIAINDVTKEREALARTIADLDTKIAGLQIAVGSAAAGGAREALGDAPAVAAKALQAAKTKLDTATADLQKSAKWLSWKLAGIAGVLSIFLIGAGYLIARSGLPNKEEIAADREEIKTMEANIADLKKRGGKIQLTTCGERLCAYASTNQGKNFPNWTGLAWKTNDGLPLVILRGY